LQVLDEADRLLDMDFGPIIDKILKVIPKERNTYLFSATMTTKVAKLQRASLNKPVRVEVSSKYVALHHIKRNTNDQILYRLHLASALPPPASQAQRFSSTLPRQRTVLIIHDHLYPNSQRRSASLARLATTRVPRYPLTRPNVPIDAFGEFEQV
jgi:hypothetical protein